MAIDTEIKGSPASIEGAAAWVRGTLAKAVRASSDRMASARSTAASDWDGEAGQAFVGRLGSAVGKVDGLERSASAVAGGLEAYASKLATLQHRMAAIRGAAQSAGLPVAAYVIEDPGPGPADPGPAPAGLVSPAAAESYNAAVTSWNAHQDKIRAYNKAVADADEVRSELTTATEGLADEYRGLEGSDWLLNASDVAGGFAGAVMEFNSSKLSETSKYFKGLSHEYLERIRGNPAGFSNADLDHWDKVARNADDVADEARALRRLSKSFPLKASGALAVAGIGLDIASGEDPVQAVASGGGGLLASVGTGMLAGAAIGSFVPIPGVGTAAGAIIGAGVGIFTSGAIDSLFENGPDVGEAVDAGWDAVQDTGGAIADGAGAVVDGIGGLFD